jgi:hypothetical protein
VYEDEGIRGVDDGGFENFAWMRKRFVDPLRLYHRHSNIIQGFQKLHIARAAR